MQRRQAHTIWEIGDATQSCRRALQVLSSESPAERVFGWSLVEVQSWDVALSAVLFDFPGQLRVAAVVVDVAAASLLHQTGQTSRCHKPG